MGNDMFNDEQLAFLELRQKETEEGLSWWKERALKAEAKLAHKYLIEEQYETACGDRDGLLRMVETLREQKNTLRSERDALRAQLDAPLADAAREAVALREALAAEENCSCDPCYCEHAIAVIDGAARLLASLSSPAPALSAEETHNG